MAMSLRKVTISLAHLSGSGRLVGLRAQSSQSSSWELDQREALAVQSIEDAIHGIIVRRSTPDWLPFVPGSSYWVPPRRGSYGIADLVERLSNTLTEEEVMSLTTTRGWPSSAFFVNEVPPPADVVLNTSRVEDEEN